VMTLMLTTGAWAAVKYKILYSFSLPGDAGQTVNHQEHLSRRITIRPKVVQVK